VGFAVLERWLRPGAADDYLTAIADLCRAIAGAPGLIATTTFLSDGDPPAALNVAEWRRQADQLSAQQLVPEKLLVAPRALTLPGGDAQWVWFEQRYLARDMGARAGVCAATRYRLTTDQVQTYLAWAAEAARAALEEGHLTGIALLERADAPGHFLALEEHRDGAARAEYERRTGPCDRSDVQEVRIFRGTAAYQWPRPGDGGG
jgi:hypothetical protein